MPTRRAFVVGSLGAVAACHPSRAAETPATAPATPPAPGGDVAAAERLVGVTYTPAERQAILDSLEEQLALLTARRSFAPPRELPPATIFDPRLRGHTYTVPAAPRRKDERPAARPLPTSDEDIAFAPLSDLSAWLRTRALGSARLTEIYLQRLTALDPKLACVVTLTADLARRQAARADAEIASGRWRGPLHGIPWGAKDLLDTAGIATTYGAEPWTTRVPAHDATVVRRLDAAGAVLVAKLSLGALAYGDIWFRGRTNNPWNLEEGSSGSSAGSAAAVVTGLVGFAIGTETLGSIVSPCMRCGATGMRPTFGRVSRAGAMPLCWSLDKIGPIARSVADCMTVLNAIAGPDDADPSTLDVPLARAEGGVAGLRIGWDPAWFAGERADALDREVLDRCRALGIELVERTLPDLPWDALVLILLAEAASAFEDLTLENLDDELAWQAPEAWPNTFRRARLIPAIDLVQADRLRRRAMLALDEAFAGLDAMISPSHEGPLLVATNFTGHPSLTLRTGFRQLPTRQGHGSAAPTTQGPTHRVPHGITLYGPLFREDLLARIGTALETALGVATERPRLG